MRSDKNPVNNSTYHSSVISLTSQQYIIQTCPLPQLVSLHPWHFPSMSRVSWVMYNVSNIKVLNPSWAVPVSTCNSYRSLVSYVTPNGVRLSPGIVLHPVFFVVSLTNSGGMTYICITKLCHQWPLVYVMDCHLCGTQPLSEPKVIYCQLDPQEQTRLKFELKFNDFRSGNCNWKCHLQR